MSMLKGGEANLNWFIHTYHDYILYIKFCSGTNAKAMYRLLEWPHPEPNNFKAYGT